MGTLKTKKETPATPSLSAATAQSGDRQPNLFGTVLAALSSGKLALVLIALLMLFSLAGAMLPQAGHMTEVQIGYWQLDNPLVTRLLGPLGLFDVFQAPLFLATIVLLAINTLTCTLICFRREGGFASLVGPVGFKRTGFLLLHLSLILLMAGGFLSVAADLDGKIILIEGQTFTDDPEQYAKMSKGPLRTAENTGLTVRLSSVDIEYAKKRYAVSVSSKIDILEDNATTGTGVVAVNRPFEHNGLTFTHDKTGYAPRISIRDSVYGRKLANSFIALETVNTDSGYVYRDFLPLPFLDQRLIVTLYPNHARKDGQLAKTGDAPDNPLLIFELEDKTGKVVKRYNAKLGDQVTIGRNTFAFTDLRRWASFRVGHDPGYPVVCAALWLGLISMVLRYLPDLREWSSEWTASMQLSDRSSAEPIEVTFEGDAIRSTQWPREVRLVQPPLR